MSATVAHDPMDRGQRTADPREAVDVLVRAADAGATYLVWRWLDDVHRPQFEVLTTERIGPALTALDAALVTPREGDERGAAARRAVGEGAFADVQRERALARTLTEALLPERLRNKIRRRFAAGQRIRLRLTPSPRLARVPWELLCLEDDLRLLEAVDIVFEPPAAVHAGRARRPQDWATVRALPPLLIIDPRLPSRVGRTLEQILQRKDLRLFSERIDEYITAGRLPDTDDDSPLNAEMTRIDLSRALSAGRSRLLYFGHVTSATDEPGSAAIHLSDTTAQWGMAAPWRSAGGREDPDDHRPFAALDLLLGTRQAQEQVWREYGHNRAELGHELWRMPPRVALIACEGGVDYRSAETFGLVVAMVNAGAELVTTTRWTLPADSVFRTVRPGFREHPTSTLALRVDTAHDGADPIGELVEWQRGELARWRTTGDLAHTPLVWASLTHTVAPAKQVDELEEDAGEQE